MTTFVQFRQVTAEELARFFHETYERLAPEHGYETRKATAVPWEDVPENNRQLMIAVCKAVIDKFSKSDNGVNIVINQTADPVGTAHAVRTQLESLLRSMV